MSAPLPPDPVRDGLYLGREIELEGARIAFPEAEYRRRLALCKGCGELANGICAQCGCFVELRAAKRQNRCPAFPPRWEGMAAAQEDEPL